MPPRSARRIAALPHCLLLLVLLAGCASLPDVGYPCERNPLPKQQPAIVGTRKELPDRRKQALLNGMAAQAGSTDILTRHIVAKEAINGRALAAGNKVTLLDDRPITMRAITGCKWRAQTGGGTRPQTLRFLSSSRRPMM